MSLDQFTNKEKIESYLAELEQDLQNIVWKSDLYGFRETKYDNEGNYQKLKKLFAVQFLQSLNFKFIDGDAKNVLSELFHVIGALLKDATDILGKKPFSVESHFQAIRNKDSQLTLHHHFPSLLQ